MIKKTLFVLIFILPFILLGAWNVYTKARWQEPTDGVTWKQRGERLTAIKVEPNSPGYLAGIGRGDILYNVKFGDATYPIQDHITLSKILWTAYRSNQLSLSYDISKRELRLEPKITLETKGTELIYYYLVLVGLTTLVLGLVIFFNAKQPFSLPYMFYFFVSLLFYSFYIFSPTGHLNILDNVIYWVDSCAFIIFPPLLFHFFLLFPKRRRIPKKMRSTLNWLYVPALLLLLSKIFIHLPNFLELNDRFILQFYQITDKLDLLQFGIFAIIAIIFLYLDSFRVKNQVVKKQLRWITYGMGLGIIPFTGLYILPYIIGQATSTVGELSIIFQGLIPLTFAYSISRYRLTDLEMILKRAVPLVASYIVIGVAYFIALSQTELLSENTLNTVILGILAIILGTTLFTPLKKLSQSVIDRMTYRRSYEFRKTLLSISQQVGRERNLQKLAQSILELTANALSLKYIVLLLPVDNQEGKYLIFKSKGERPTTRARLVLDPELNELLKSRVFISYFSLTDRSELQTKFRKLSNYGLYHLLPLKVEDRIIGCLGMGKKTDSSYLTSEDMDLLITISSPVALALENAYLFNQAMDRAVEFERLKDYSENIIESLTVGVAVLDQRGHIIGWNRVLEDTFGLSKDRVIEKRLVDILGEKNFVAIFPSDTQQDLRLMSEIAMEMPSGEKKIFDIAKTPLLDNNRKPYGTIIVFEDISEKVTLQQQLLTSEKLASIGLLSAGVAHEINTPLTGISSYVQILQKKMKDSPAAPILEKIEAQTDRVGRIVKNLLNFARSPSESAYYQVDLKESLSEIIALIEYKLKNMNIKLGLQLTQVPSVTAQGERLQQVFINIILNAIDAMPSGGKLSISLTQEGELIFIKIKDTGTGIKEQHKSHIFDPFFTTKGIGKGTGLGLSISYAIIKEHEGHIAVDSQVDRGTLFTISLPVDLNKSKQLTNSRL
ncbi:ATP-binding protein [Acidobacteriota bacterium]